MSPKSSPDTMEIASANRTVRVSIEISSSRGRPAGASATNSFSAAYARPTPAAPPSSPKTMLSDSSSPAMRFHPAPSAERIASSC